MAVPSGTSPMRGSICQPRTRVTGTLISLGSPRVFRLKDQCLCVRARPSIARIYTPETTMPLDHWLAFVAGSAVLWRSLAQRAACFHALGHGRKPASAIVAGVALGDFTAMTASMLGLAPCLPPRHWCSTGLRWLVDAYLIYWA